MTAPDSPAVAAARETAAALREQAWPLTAGVIEAVLAELDETRREAERLRQPCRQCGETGDDHDIDCTRGDLIAALVEVEIERLRGKRLARVRQPHERDPRVEQ